MWEDVGDAMSDSIYLNRACIRLIKNLFNIGLLYKKIKFEQFITRLDKFIMFKILNYSIMTRDRLN